MNSKKLERNIYYTKIFNKGEMNTAGNLRIVFMGTSEFAVSSLDALIVAGFLPVCVVTAPDKPAGRGMKLNESAVKKYALTKGLEILQPEKLKDDVFIQELKSFQADMQIVVAFRMLPEVVWNMPPLGTINLHASLLPQYRGAAPINWAIINGEKQTGLTTFKLRQEIDTGDILLQEKIPIGNEETAGELHDRMKFAGAALLVKTVNGLIGGWLEPISQISMNPESSVSTSAGHVLKTAPKIFTETCKIDWNQSAKTIYDLIRGLSPHPAAFTVFSGRIFKIYRAELEISVTSTLQDFISDGRTFLKFRCADGFIAAREIQMEGKKKMFIEEFLRGFRFDHQNKDL
jgi:methionyl-tRNA formyltransferase